VDDIALATLWDELRSDCVVAADALATAAERIREMTPAALDSCAHHLSRLFNVIEQMSLRIAKAFENNIDDEKGWHVELIRRMTIAISGVRPALFPIDLQQPLHDLRAFRHVFNHAYDLRLDPDKLRLILKYAREVTPRLPSLVRNFVDGVATMHGLALPPE
jgi:hypothetical protein